MLSAASPETPVDGPVMEVETLGPESMTMDGTETTTIDAPSVPQEPPKVTLKLLFSRAPELVFPPV